MSGSDDVLRQAIRAARIGIFENDHVRRAIYWSPRMREIHGWGPDEPVTLEALARVIHPADAPAFMEELRRSHDPASEGITSVDHRIVRRDGSVRWISMRGETEFAGEGPARRPVRTVGAVIDDTERREVLDALRLKDQAIDPSLNAMAITDAEGRNVYVNSAFLRMWGYADAAEIRGRLPMEFFEGPAAFAVFLELQQAGRWEGELVARRRDGSRFDVVLSATAIYDADGRIVNTAVTTSRSRCAIPASASPMK